MRTPNRLLFCLLFLAFAAASAQAQDVDFSGEWNLELLAFFEADEQLQGTPDCLFQGTAEITQDATALAGTASYTLSEGDGNCPEEMSGAVSGTVDGSGITLGMTMGPLGSVSFDGFASIPVVAGQLGASGDFQVVGGPFSGTSGVWSGVLGGAPPAPIPTLNVVGVIALALLLLASGYYLLRR